MTEITALVIDDQSINVEVLARLLVENNIVAFGIDDVNDLDSMINGLPVIDIIFLDIEFPRVDGFEVYTYLRACKKLKNTRIIAYSVHLDMIGAVRDNGFDGFLGKPLNSARFPEQLEQIIRGEQIWEY